MNDTYRPEPEDCTYKQSVYCVNCLYVQGVTDPHIQQPHRNSLHTWKCLAPAVVTINPLNGVKSGPRCLTVKQGDTCDQYIDRRPILEKEKQEAKDAALLRTMEEEARIQLEKQAARAQAIRIAVAWCSFGIAIASCAMLASAC